MPLVQPANRIAALRPTTDNIRQLHARPMSTALDKLFRPSSVALIGASANPAKMSNVALRNLSNGKYSLYPVNPREATILGLKCYPSILDVPEQIVLVLRHPKEVAGFL